MPGSISPLYWPLLVVAAYFLGSIPFAQVLGRLKGVDLRVAGTGNVGAGNLTKTAGIAWGLTAGVLDGLKGLIPVLIAKEMGLGPGAAGLAGLAAVIGHNWSIFLGFTGGKGIATGLGSVLAFTPGVALGVLAVWGVLVAATRYVSLGSVVSVALYPPAVAIVYPGNIAYLAFGLVGASAVIFKHRSNLRRLMDGTERRVGGSRAAPDATGPGDADQAEGGGDRG